jgi:hypothetical protein
MKRIAYSLLIGAGCAFLFFGISKLQENKRKIKVGLLMFSKKSHLPGNLFTAQNCN